MKAALLLFTVEDDDDEDALTNRLEVTSTVDEGSVHRPATIVEAAAGQLTKVLLIQGSGRDIRL